MRIIITILALASALATGAQVRPYIAAGSEHVIMSAPSPYSDDFQTNAAWRLGLGAYVPVMKNLYVVPELTYSSFTYYNNGWIPDAQKFRFSQLHLPVVADYRLKCSDWLTLDVGAGPFVSYGVGGDAIDKDRLDRWNAGVALRSRVVLGVISVGVSYDMGLLNMLSYYDGSPEMKLSMLGVNFGFSF